MSLVTIRGLLGSGASEIGKEVADRLKTDYVDREIIAQVASRLQRPEDEVVAKEMPPSGILGRIAEALQHSLAFGVGFEGVYLPAWQIPLDDTRYLQILESVIKELAKSKSLVIRGRGSHFILRDYPQALHVLLVAPTEVRLKRVMETLKVGSEAAHREMVRWDNSGREFIKRYFKADLEDPLYYDLVLNTAQFSFENCSSMVIDALSYKDPSVKRPAGNRS